MFHGQLFELDPSLSKNDMSEQGRKLMLTLAFALNGLNDFDANVPALRELGRRYGGYGAKPKNYDTVGTALLWTLQLRRGPAFTAEVEAAWSKMYAALASVMIEAANAAVAS
jgi:hemoglobin-like flavoprotein